MREDSWAKAKQRKVPNGQKLSLSEQINIPAPPPAASGSVSPPKRGKQARIVEGISKRDYMREKLGDSDSLRNDDIEWPAQYTKTAGVYLDPVCYYVC